jgi:hypothetical protein
MLSNGIGESPCCSGMVPVIAPYTDSLDPPHISVLDNIEWSSVVLWLLYALLLLPQKCGVVSGIPYTPP